MRPNILFVFPDQWRADWTAMNERLPIRTPNLLRLAERGVSFRNAITPSPLCAPARACIASGMEYERCGVPTNAQDYPVNQATFYMLLQKAGYHTMGCGKFDLAKAAFGWALDGSSRLKEWGFDEGIDSEGKWDGVGSGRVEPRGPYMAYLEKRGLRGVHVEDMLRRRDRFAVFPTPLPEDAYSDNWIGTAAARLIDGAPADRPWFLQVNFTGPHDPWDITQAMSELYQNADLPVPAGLTPREAELHRGVRRNYAAMIENIDRWLGAFVSALEKARQLSNTLIVVSSDHGEMLGERGQWGKSVPFQASIAVPLVIAGPAVREGAVVSDPTTTLDLTGTFLDFAEVPIPASWDTMSLRPLLENADSKPIRGFVRSALPDWRLVFDGRFKLIQVKNGAILFDLDADQGESRNIAAVDASTVKRLSSAGKH